MTASTRRRSTGSRLALGVAVLALLAGVLTACTSGSHPGRGLPDGPYSSRPNIVFVLTDDLSSNLVRYMPHVEALEQAGMRFTNFTTSDSLCCPSRATIFTGQFPHNTKIFTNGAPDGGFPLFHARGEEQHSFAVPLHNAGYRTAFMGKYLNGLKVPSDRRPQATGQAHYVPPGWSTWVGAGFAYDEYGYDLDVNGTLHHYGHEPDDYLTDVIDGMGNRFIERSARDRKPFLLEMSTFAPHSPAIPAPRDVDAFDLQAPRGPSFGRKPTAAPAWLAKLPKAPPGGVAELDKQFTRRVESVQAVDRMVGHLQDTLRRTHQLKNTIFVFTSDNGFHLGEHGLGGGKLTAFDTDVLVPLVVSGPGIAAGSVNGDVVENADLAPTFEELAGAMTPATVDGRSLVPLLHGRRPSWRTFATIEHHGPDFVPGDPDRQTHFQGNPPTYQAMRSSTFTYVRYAGGQREYYNRTVDPDELHNVISRVPPSRLAQLNAVLDRLITCRGATQCWAAATPAPGS